MVRILCKVFVTMIIGICCFWLLPTFAVHLLDIPNTFAVVAGMVVLFIGVSTGSLGLCRLWIKDLQKGSMRR